MNRCLSVLGCFLAVILVIATLYATEPHTPTKVSTSELGGADRYMTYLSTDKPIYRPGETMYVRGVVLHHRSRKPLPSNSNLQAAFNIKGPKGDSVASGWVTLQESVFGLQWKVPDEQAGGEFTVNVTYPSHGYTPAERKFDVRAYRAPRLKSQITFLRDGYGVGDEVAAMLAVERAEGGIPEGATVAVIARVDGKEVFHGPAVVDSNGKCVARFELPKKIERGEGTLAMVIQDGGVVETASKTIPILLQTVDLELYPEGGDLIAGLPNRVYFEAFTPAKKPADLAGIVLDEDGN
ncbi:MG2 domain-containing protein, partial [bacterium]|nr:MG2 domain-containing protein [bacterium]